MFLVFAAASVPFRYDGTLPAGQTLTVRDVNGAVRVRTGDRLAIRATKHAEHGDPNAVAINVENRADGIVVCVRYPPNAGRGCDQRGSSNHGNDNDTTVDFDITVPRGIVLDARTVNGEIDAANDGPATASTVNGRLRLEARDVRSAKTVNGSIALRVLGPGRGDIDASSVNGTIDLTLPPGTGVTFDAKVLNGSIRADGVTVARPRFGPGESAAATLGDGARHVSLQTINGSITLSR